MHPLQITDLTKQYGRTRVLTNIDLIVEENELFALVGPNGAGKTTLFDIILNNTHPSDGEVRVFGYDSHHDVVAVHRRLGVLPQGFDVYPGLTARQHLSYAIEANQANDDPYSLLDRVGLKAVADQLASEFSHGMTRRLGCAMALVDQPELLIFDEPFSGLDPNGKRRMRSLIFTELDRGATVVLSSHDLTPVRDISTRIGILTEGQLVATGSESTLRANAPLTTVFAVDGPVSERLQQELTALPAVTGVGLRDGKVILRATDQTAKTRVEEILNSADVRGFDPTLDDIFAYYTLDRSV